MKGLKIMWNEHRVATVLLVFVLGLAAGDLSKMAYHQYENSKLYAKFESLTDKSQAHQMILRNMLSCMKVDNLPESACITNTISLAEVNGYKDQVGEVFRDAGIPSH